MLGEEIAVPAHHEGRRAFQSGKFHSENPYDKYAKYDTDEYLRYRNWDNGWNFAWWKENTQCAVPNAT